MNPIECFFWGCFGSAAVEVVDLVYRLRLPRDQRPEFLADWFYWGARILLMGVAGVIAAAYDIDSKVAALHIGASTPLIVQALARKKAELD